MLTPHPRALLHLAYAEHFAMPAFNVCNLEMAKAVVEAAVAERAPVIVQTYPGDLAHAGFGQGLGRLPGLIQALAAEAPVPVILHLDHGPSFEYDLRCLRAGYNSVMFDGHDLPLDEALAETAAIARAAHALNATVEGELGTFGEGQGSHELTWPEEVPLMFERGHADMLAVSVGSEHGRPPACSSICCGNRQAGPGAAGAARRQRHPRGRSAGRDEAGRREDQHRRRARPGLVRRLPRRARRRGRPLRGAGRIHAPRPRGGPASPAADGRQRAGAIGFSACMQKRYDIARGMERPAPAVLSSTWHLAYTVSRQGISPSGPGEKTIQPSVNFKEADLRMMRQIKIVVEKHPDGYVAYPIDMKGVVEEKGTVTKKHWQTCGRPSNSTSRLWSRHTGIGVPYP